MKPLRDLGIPTAGIVDIDVFKEGGIVWAHLLNGACIAEPLHEGLENHRLKVFRAFKDARVDMNKVGGIKYLDVAERDAASEVCDQLAKYGAFVVRHGKLESWLPQLAAAGHGPDWVIEAFEKMGEDPDTEEYVKPGNGDVWEFVGEIKRWLADPNRKGIPA
jgi:hypothetical protein